MIELQTIDEAIDDNGLKILVHAPSGFGKTVLCATTGRKSLLINAESGLLSLKEVPEDIKKNIDVVTVNELTELGELYDMLAQGGHPYDWIMLDSLSEIAEVCLSKHMKEAKDGRKAYGALADDMYTLIREFRDLPKVCIYMSAKQEFREDSSGTSKYRPMMPGRNLRRARGSCPSNFR